MSGAGDEYLLNNNIIYYCDLGTPESNGFLNWSQEHSPTPWGHSELGDARGIGGQGSEIATFSNSSSTSPVGLPHTFSLESCF